MVWFCFVISSLRKPTACGLSVLWRCKDEQDTVPTFEQTYHSRAFEQLVLICEMCKDEQSCTGAQQRGSFVLRRKRKLKRSSNFWVWLCRRKQVSVGRAAGYVCLHLPVDIHTYIHTHVCTNSMHRHALLCARGGRDCHLANSALVPIPRLPQHPHYGGWKSYMLIVRVSCEIQSGQLAIFGTMLRAFRNAFLLHIRDRCSWHYFLVFSVAVIITPVIATVRHGQRSGGWAATLMSTAAYFSTAHMRKLNLYWSHY